MVQQGYKFSLYYTWKDWFATAMNWYEQLDDKQSALDNKALERAHAVWHDAIWMIKELFEQRKNYKASDFIMELVRLAFQAWASDLHLQSEKGWVYVKVRVDGILHSVVWFSHAEYEQYLAKIKFLSGIKMNISKIPQDGRFQFNTSVHGATESVDVRVNTLPGLYHDGVVMRYLESAQSLDSFVDLGFSERHIKQLEIYLAKKHWMIFVTGPTGSGKTTTLYTMLDSINTGEIKIITLEDPIEYQLAGIQQSQINAKDGYTYEQWLKAVLRHDPDIILVWETRSLDTADTIVNAALTWHLVFTTVHTNSALETLSRLISMWVKTYLLAPALQLICAQRLIRKLCPHCTTRAVATAQENKEMTMYLSSMKASVPWDGTLPQAVGCDKCNSTWYKWRQGVFELLSIDDWLRNMIIDEKPYDEMFEHIRKYWFVTMIEDWIEKVVLWLTTLDEVRKLV